MVRQINAALGLLLANILTPTEAPPLRGLGEKLADIERLIADDAESLVRLRELIVAGRGGNNGNQYTRAKSGKADNISIATDLFTPAVPAKKKADAGTSRAYTLTRLKNERPDLFERVVAKELTANRAAIEAGWRKKETAHNVARYDQSHDQILRRQSHGCRFHRPAAPAVSGQHSSAVARTS